MVLVARPKCSNEKLAAKPVDCGDGTLPKADNIKWLVEGYLGVGAAVTLKGTFITFGAATLGTGVHLEGRLYSYTAATIGIQTVITMPAVASHPSGYANIEGYVAPVAGEGEEEEEGEGEA